MAIWRRSGDATVFELVCWLAVMSVMFPIVAVVLVLRYRVIQAIVAGYREGASGSTAPPA
jgi:hypothetical protein